MDPACGDRLTVDLDVEDGVVAAARFRVEGCAGAIAVGSALTTLLPGRRFPEHGLRPTELEAVLGAVPRVKRHAFRLALSALNAATPLG